MGKPIDKLEDPPDRVLLGKDIHFSAYGDDSLISQVLFITGKRGSGKSWTAAVLMMLPPIQITAVIAVMVTAMVTAMVTK